MPLGEVGYRYGRGIDTHQTPPEAVRSAARSVVSQNISHNYIQIVVSWKPSREPFKKVSKILQTDV